MKVKFSFYLHFQVSKKLKYVNRKFRGISESAHSRGRISGDFSVLFRVWILMKISRLLCVDERFESRKLMLHM